MDIGTTRKSFVRLNVFYMTPIGNFIGNLCIERKLYFPKKQISKLAACKPLTDA